MYFSLLKKTNMKKNILFVCLTSLFSANATIHIFRVWSGYYQFYRENLDPINLGDTLQWRPLDEPMMAHTITSTTIPVGAASFDYLWQMPVDTFFQYIPSLPGLYEYECTPHAVSMNMKGSFEVLGNGLDVYELFQSKISLYPNPCSNTIYTPFALKKNYEILDINLKSIKRGKNEGFIQVEDLKKGLYYFKIEDEIRVFIKQE